MLNNRYAGIIPPNTDLRQLTVNQVKDDIIGYLKRVRCNMPIKCIWCALSGT